MTPLPASPFMEINPDHGGLAAIEAELSDVLFNMDFMSADPSPPPGPSDLEELQALLTPVRPLHQAAA